MIKFTERTEEINQLFEEFGGDISKIQIAEALGVLCDFGEATDDELALACSHVLSSKMNCVPAMGLRNKSFKKRVAQAQTLDEIRQVYDEIPAGVNFYAAVKQEAFKKWAREFCNLSMEKGKNFSGLKDIFSKTIPGSEQSIEIVKRLIDTSRQIHEAMKPQSA